MSGPVDISASDHDGVFVVSVSGELDLFAAPELRERLLDEVRDGRREVVLDLRETTFMDSTALGVIIAALKALQERHGRLVLVNERASIDKTLAITGLDRVLQMERDLDAAIAAARGG